MSIPYVFLRFDLAQVLLLAEDATAATRRRTRPVFDTSNSPGRQVDAGPCLILVRDDGVYLMSTNTDAPTGPDGRLPLAYAHGFEPARNDWRTAWDACNLPGDDFAEYLELADSGLLATMRTARWCGYRYFTITVTEEDLGLGFTR